MVRQFLSRDALIAGDEPTRLCAYSLHSLFTEVSLWPRCLKRNSASSPMQRRGIESFGSQALPGRRFEVLLARAAGKAIKRAVGGHGPRAPGGGGGGQRANGPTGRGARSTPGGGRGRGLGAGGRGANGLRKTANGPRPLALGPWPKASVSVRIFRGHSELSLRNTKRKTAFGPGVTRALSTGQIDLELAKGAKNHIPLAFCV
jgi:hypothetical protein